MDTKTKPAPRRVLCLWLPRFPAERCLKERQVPGAKWAPGAKRAEDRRPFAVWTGAGNRLGILAANRAAEAAGIHGGQSLADARALYPALITAPADGAADARVLKRLAAWCRRFSPWTAPVRADRDTTPPGEAGIWLEATGCAHLVGGEEALTAAIAGAMTRAGFTARVGLAGTPGAAYALARFGDNHGDNGGNGGENGTGTAPHAIARPGREAEALAPLPIAALRLEAGIREGLDGLGLRRIGDLYPLIQGPKRATLARRFPPMLLERIDAALGRRFEPLGPGRERPRFVARLTLAEPTRGTAVIARACERLVGELAALLARHGLGARRFVFTAFDAGGQSRRVAIGTVRAMAVAAPLMRLFAFELEKIDPRPGIDGFSLEAFATAPLSPRQGRLARGTETFPDGDADDDSEATLAPLIDRLHGRLGRQRVGRMALRPNHLPERAQAFAHALAGDPHLPPARARIIPGPGPLIRPVRLLPRPTPVCAMAEVPDGPPIWFRWRGVRHRVAKAAGPERIALDWWTLPGWQANPLGPAQPPGLGAAIRDYYRVETAAGARFWIYRAGLHRPDAPARWFLHGVFP